MTAQDLKNSILQLAMQGKLSPQNPNDEPASELLKRIKEEKARLIKKGKIKKEKPLSPISDNEMPFELPENWEWVRWGTLAESIQYGYNAPAQSSGRIKMVRISDIQDNSVNWELVPYCDIDEENIDLYLLRSNDILFARTGGTVGKSFLVSDVPEEAIYAGYLIRTRYSLSLSPKYLKFFMESQLYWNQLRNGTIATAQPNCNGKTLGKMILPLPPYEEQKRIVAKIEELLPLVERYDESEKRLLELNKKFPDELRKAILQQAVQGKLTEQDPHDEPASELLKRIKAEKARLIKEGTIKKQKSPTPIREEEKPFEIPDNWIWCRVSDIVLQNLGGGTPAKNVPGYWGGDIPWASVKDLPMDDIWLNTTQDAITRSGLNNSSSNLIPRDNIIICTRMGLGKVVVNTIDVAINQDLRALLVSQYIHKMYLIHFFKSARLVGKGQTVKGITIDVLENMLLPLPPLEEQRRIVAKIDEVLPLCDRLK